MNFKSWLLISEEEKIAKAKPLPDVNSTRYIKNAQNLIALGNHFQLLTSLQTLNLLNNKINKDGFAFLKSKLSSNIIM